MTHTIAVLLAGLSLAAANPNMPKNYDTYGPTETKVLFDACMSAGHKLGYTRDSAEAFCTCHVFVVEEVYTKDELYALSEEKMGDVFRNAGRACASIGFKPKKMPQQEPKPSKPEPRAYDT